MLGLTTAATIYLGWHYIVDDIGGLAIGAMAVLLARALTGFELGTARRPVPPSPARRRDGAAGAAVANRRGIVAGPLVAARHARRGADPHRLGRACRSATPTTSPRSICCSSASASPGSSGWTSCSRARALSQRVPALAGGDGARAPGALDDAPLPGRGRRAGRVLRHLHGVPQPEGDRAAGAARTRTSTASSPTWTATLFGAGTDPAILLHRLLGEGIPTHILSTAYVAFIVFLPLTIGLALVFSRELQAGLLYTTAQSVNWILGAASYFLLPSLGPATPIPARSPRLPYSEVARLQGVLLDQRVAFLARPGGRDAAEHRRVRVAAHLDELHRGARRPPARRRPAAEARAVDLVRDHVRRHDLPRLALRARRRRRHGDGRARARDRRAAHRDEPARRARSGAPRAPMRPAGVPSAEPVR